MRVPPMSTKAIAAALAEFEALASNVAANMLGAKYGLTQKEAQEAATYIRAKCAFIKRAQEALERDIASHAFEVLEDELNRS